MNEYLSVLKNAGENCITYYVGNKLEDVNHLKDCTLLCNKDFNPKLPNVKLIQVNDPQLEFYRLSKKYKKDYLECDKMIFDDKTKSHIHKEAKIGNNVKIFPGCIISRCTIQDNVEIHPNVTIYAESIIGKNAIIQASSVIGAAGVMWVWDGDERVNLEQLGSVEIGENCFIGSNVTIARGSANDRTKIGDHTCIAHGTSIGHGCRIGNYNHFANNVALGGSVVTGKNCFFGSGSVVHPGKKLTDNIILSASGTVTKDLEEQGVYVGTPAIKKKEITTNLSGVPKWTVGIKK